MQWLASIKNVNYIQTNFAGKWSRQLLTTHWL